MARQQCFLPNKIIQTGFSLRMTFVGHKVNWGVRSGPGHTSPLSVATARRENGAPRLFTVAGSSWAETRERWSSGSRGDQAGPLRHTEGRRSLSDEFLMQTKQRKVLFRNAIINKIELLKLCEWYLFLRMEDRSHGEAGWTGGCQIQGPCQRRTIPTKTSQTLATPTWSCSSDSFSIMTWRWRLKTVGYDTFCP